MVVDDDTPEDAYSVTTQTGETWELIFSDEFDTPGRTFWPGGASAHALLAVRRPDR